MKKKSRIERSKIDLKARMAATRQKAIERYYQNPNKCKWCLKIIEVGFEQRVPEVKVKKFCNQSCSARFINKNRVYKRKIKPKVVKQPKPKKIPIIPTKTKGELLQERGFFKMRSAICKNSRDYFRKFNELRVCKICQYDKHVEVCHIKAVKDFDDSTLISEINSTSNLVYLCPNHHWEFDNGILEI